MGKEYRTITTDSKRKVKHYKSAFFSDIHLGTRGCQYDELIHVLNHYHFDNIYLIGDIFDGWKISSSKYWHQRHTDIIQKFLKKTRKGSKIYYITGNHDEFLLNFLGNFGRIKIVNQFETIIRDKKIMIMHGHQFDIAVKYAKWLAFIGGLSYDLLIVLNRWVNKLRSKVGLKHWSMSSAVKNFVKNTINFIYDYESTVIGYTEEHALDGIIVGHIHQPDIKFIGNIIYMNPGDFIEHNSFILEGFNSRFILCECNRNKVKVIKELSF